MKGSTSLSIITCTWNSEKYLQECIESVKNQSWNLSIEHIFVDGLSTDKTIEIIQSYQEECKDRIDVKILQSSPKGVYNAMNQGIDNATGEYLLFLNSDDYLEDGILAQYLEQVSLSKKDIYYGIYWLLYCWRTAFSNRKISSIEAFPCKAWISYLILSSNLFDKKAAFWRARKIRWEEKNCFRLWFLA